MKYSIGRWIDSKLQKQIKCISQEKDFKNLQSIYEKMYNDPNAALNQTRQHIEQLFENFFEKHNLEASDFQTRLALCNKLNKNEIVKKHFLAMYNDKPLVNSILDLIYSHGSLVRVYGNNGSHSGIMSKEQLSQMAISSFIAFFELYAILNDEKHDLKCKGFNDFIYNKLEVIYETKDDVEEWEKIRFNKLKFNYDLYQIEEDIKSGKVVLNKIIEKEREKNSSKNIYFLNLNNYKVFKEMYQNLEDMDEDDYFDITEKTIDTDTIDMIPLQILPKDENKPYKWDMCYINLSIELNEFGVDLILFLNFNQEKLDLIAEEYNLEFKTF